MHVTHAYKGQRNVLLLSTTWVTEMELSPTPLPTEPSCQSRHFSFDHCSATTNNTYSRTQMSACIPRHKCGFSLVSLGWRMNPGPRESVVFTFYKTCSFGKWNSPSRWTLHFSCHIRDAFVKNLWPLIRHTFILPPLSLAGVWVSNQMAAGEDKQKRLFGSWILGS